MKQKNIIKVAPSILSADFSKIGEEIQRIEQYGADLIHCDVMDGVFVPNITFGPKMIKDIKKHTNLPLDVHLMIIEPERYVEEFIKAGADILTIHAEATKKVIPTLTKIKELNCKCGIVISPDTPPETIYEYIEYCDMVLVMSVYPGFGGQKFIPAALEKIKKLRKFIDSLEKDIDLEIDGGITLDNVSEVTAAGANIIVAGNTVFTAENPHFAISQLKKS